MSEAAEDNGLLARSSGTSAAYATPWARYWAKMVDLWFATLVGLVVWFAVWFVTGLFAIPLTIPAWLVALEETSTTDAKPISLLWQLAMLIAALVIDACIQGSFGTTLGLKAIGARLERTDHSRVSLAVCLRRNLQILIFGLWLGFLSFVPLFRNYRRLSRGELTWWDERCETRVVDCDGSLLRTCLAVGLLLAIAALLVGWAAAFG